MTNAPPTRRQLVEAALLYAGENALVTGLEACRRHGLSNLPDNCGVHLLVPKDRRLHSTDYVIVERAPVQALLTEAVQRGRVSPRWLNHELEAGSKRGTAVPRAVLKDITEGARSIAEIDAMRVWERTGLPRPS